MLEQLKNLAMQSLQEKMQGNSLNEEATNEASGEGLNAIMQTIQGGDISQLTSLFSGEAQGENGIMQNVQGQLSQIFQNKGMAAEEAQQEAQSTASHLFQNMAQKFQSSEEADSAFDISQITNLVGGDAGNIINMAKGFLGK